MKYMKFIIVLFVSFFFNKSEKSKSFKSDLKMKFSKVQLSRPISKGFMSKQMFG